jgi:hypothetical protein
VQHQNPTAEHVRALTIQALKEANIEEHCAQHVRSIRSDRTIIYWQPVEDRIELIVDRNDHSFGALHCRFSILPIAYLVAEFFLEDAAAINTLVAVFEYLQGSLSDLLPGIAEGIQARDVYRSFPVLLPHQKYGLKFVPLILGASLSRRDLNYQQRNKALRGGDTGEWRGGSLPDFPINDEQRALISWEYPSLLRHWQKIKKLRQNKLANWRGYAKLDEPDTPDDLLNRLAGKVPPGAALGGAYLGIPSTLAIEHAARRAGIPPNRYSSHQLGRLRRQGDKILSRSKTPPK